MTKSDNNDKDIPTGRASDQTRLDEEGIALWKHVTRSVTPLSEKTRDENQEEFHQTPDTNKAPRRHFGAPRRGRRTKPGASVAQGSGGQDTGRDKKETLPGLDARTEKRFRQGKMDIDATLDLHGMTQTEAHDALKDFVARGYGRGWRCVLVITGKGRSNRNAEASHWLEDEAPGVLKRKVPGWLSMPPIRSLILRTAPAKRRHGGGGALYVLIRRKR